MGRPVRWGRDGVGRLGQTGADAMTERRAATAPSPALPVGRARRARRSAPITTSSGVFLDHDERALFELLTLEGAQAGLSWSLVLSRREGYRRAFEAST